MATRDESSLIRCSICFNSKEGRQARILSCLHSFCQECLKLWHEKRHKDGHCARTQVDCPTCQTISALPSGDISDLPMDITVQQFPDYVNKESTLFCHVCKIKKGTTACMMCFVVLCDTCAQNHKLSPLFSSHELTRNICGLHGAAFQGVCTTCMCGVCLTCVNEGIHRNHPLENMSSGIKKIKSQVKKCTIELQEMLRQGNLESHEKRKFLKHFQRIEDMKMTLCLIKKEVMRLEKEITEHERLCNAKIDAVFKEYEAHGKRASGAIVNGNQLLEEDEAVFLDKLKSSDVPDEEMCSLLSCSLSSIPYFNAVSVSNCRIDDATDVLESLKNCKIVCAIGNMKTIPHTPEYPVQVFKKDCGDEYNIRKPWRLCGTREGNVIVCSSDGGPVYKVYKDGKKTLLLDDCIATCVHGGDVYAISTGGGTLTWIKQDDFTLSYKLIPPISKPKGLAVSDDNVFILSSNALVKQSLYDTESRETFHINDCKGLSYLLKIYDKGMTKLVLTDWYSHKVMICDESGAELTRFGDHGSRGGSLSYPKGITMMSNGNLLVADQYNHRIVEYDMDGKFIRNLLTEGDGLRYPQDLVYKYPYLWILETHLIIKPSIKLFRF